MAFTFFLIPFAYFYYEEYEEQGQTKMQRRTIAMKYTFIFLAIGDFLFMFGLFVKPSVLPPQIDLEWFEYLLTESCM
jgi:LMBR1 domain-containing protein 1